MTAARFTCAMCHGTFDKGSDEEAEAEMRAIFGDLRPEERAVVCDDCVKLMNPDNHPHLVEESMAETLRERKP